MLKAIESEKQKREPYKWSSSTLQSTVGKYASQHGVAAAAQNISSKLEERVSKSIVHSIRSSCIESVKHKRALELDEEAEIVVLPLKMHSRPVLLGEVLYSLVHLR